MKEIRTLGYQGLESGELGNWKNISPISKYPNTQIPISKLPNTPFYFIKQAEAKTDRIDAEIMLTHLLGISRAELYIYEDNICNEILNKFNEWVNERSAGKPLQYIIGKTEFMGLEFIVTPDVFIPRPETELLVEATINLIRSMNYELSTINLLDLGTGSGNIAISLTKFVTDCKILGSDVSYQALCIARENAKLNLVYRNIEFVLSDLFENLKGRKFDIIVSNPPYVATRDVNKFSKEIRFEPRFALDGGQDGLDFYRRIIKEAPDFLKNRGYLILEMGFNQANEIEVLLREYNFNNILFLEDYIDIERIAIAQWIN